MSTEETFLKDVIKRFHFYKDMGDKTFEQLGDKDFFIQPSSESNSIAIIIQHLYGNMRSRFTDFLIEDGEKPWRNRDAEFEPMDVSKADLLSFWNAGWEGVFSALQTLHSKDLTKTVYIRQEPMTVIDALLRQLAHYAYHVGQVVYVAKMIKDAAWKTLSIPKRRAGQVNNEAEQQNK
jgi:hypothetical protein